MGRDAVGAAAEARGRVRLGVEVDEQAALAGLREAGGEVDGGRRLADAALLVRDCVDPGGHPPRLAASGGRGVERIRDEERSRIRPTHLCPLRGILKKAMPALRRADASSRRPVRRGKPGGVGPVLRIASRPCGDSSSVAAEPLRDARDALRLGRLADPEDDEAALADEREAPLGRGRRVGERLRDRDAERLRLLLLGAAPDDLEVRELGRPASRGTPHLRRSASSRVTLASGSDAASGIPGVPPPEPTSTIGPSVAGDQIARRAARRRAAPRGRRRGRGSPSGRASR